VEATARLALDGVRGGEITTGRVATLGRVVHLTGARASRRRAGPAVGRPSPTAHRASFRIAHGAGAWRPERDLRDSSAPPPRRRQGAGRRAGRVRLLVPVVAGVGSSGRISHAEAKSRTRCCPALLSPFEFARLDRQRNGAAACSASRYSPGDLHPNPALSARTVLVLPSSRADRLVARVISSRTAHAPLAPDRGAPEPRGEAARRRHGLVRGAPHHGAMARPGTRPRPPRCDRFARSSGQPCPVRSECSKRSN